MSPFMIFIFILLLLAHNNNVFSKIDHYLRPTPSFRTREKPEQYFEITPPVPADPLFPSCAAHPIIRHSFANTIGSPPYSCPYTPPRSCPGPWARVVLELSISSRGDQSERIAAMWLGGAELIRTSTAQPTKYGIFWKVRKDVTRYTALLSQKNLSATMMLENIVDKQFTGVYHVNAILYFYNKTNNLQLKQQQQPSGWLDYNKNNANHTGHVLRSHIGAGSWGFYGPPADMIIPISSEGGRGFWFRVENETDVHTKRIIIPQNTKQAVLELYVSYHDNDEFWYSNLPQSYIKGNNLTTLRGNGAFREVYVTIDGNFVDSEVPFPVIFTGGVNPLFWEPIVAIGAFDMPTYDMNLTPMLETLLDGKEHEFGIAIAHGISYWLVNANLHLWVDTQSEAVVAKAVMFGAPAVQVQRKSQFNKLDGRFQVQASRKTLFMGWVMSNDGNFTTITTKDYKVRNQIMYRFNGTLKVVKQKVKVRKQVRILNDLGMTIARAGMKRQYPLTITTMTIPGTHEPPAGNSSDTNSTQPIPTYDDPNSYVVHTNITHGIKEKFTDRTFKSNIQNTQIAGGWMQVTNDSVVAGSAITHQTYGIRDPYLCYFRTVSAIDGMLIGDNGTTCSSASFTAF